MAGQAGAVKAVVGDLVGGQRAAHLRAVIPSATGPSRRPARRPDAGGQAGPVTLTGGVGGFGGGGVAGGRAVKVALTSWAVSIVILHAPVPEQAPPQPAKVEPEPALGMSVTLVPASNACEQTEPQSIAVGELETVPEPEPDVETVRMG